MAAYISIHHPITSSQFFAPARVCGAFSFGGFIPPIRLSKSIDVYIHRNGMSVPNSPYIVNLSASTESGPWHIDIGIPTPGSNYEFTACLKHDNSIVAAMTMSSITVAPPLPDPDDEPIMYSAPCEEVSLKKIRSYSIQRKMSTSLVFRVKDDAHVNDYECRVYKTDVVDTNITINHSGSPISINTRRIGLGDQILDVDIEKEIVERSLTITLSNVPTDDVILQVIYRGFPSRIMSRRIVSDGH